MSVVHNASVEDMGMVHTTGDATEADYGPRSVDMGSQTENHPFHNHFAVENEEVNGVSNGEGRRFAVGDEEVDGNSDSNSNSCAQSRTSHEDQASLSDSSGYR